MISAGVYFLAFDEGDPEINNTVKTADSTRGSELAKIYSNPDQEN